MRKQVWIAFILCFCLASLSPMSPASAAPATGAFTPAGSYGGSGSDLPYAGIALADGYLLAGATMSGDGDVTPRDNVSDNYHDAWAVRVDAQGDILWSVLIDDAQLIYEQFTGVVQMPGGRFALLYAQYGRDQQTQEDIERGVAYIVDNTGAILGTLDVPAQTEYLYPLSDGLMAMWYEETPLDGNWSSRLTTLAQLDWDGNILWQREYPELTPMRVLDIVQEPDHFWLIGDWRDDVPYSGAVIKLDAQGAIEGQLVLPAKAYGGLKTGISDGAGGLIAAGTQSDTMDGASLHFYGHAIRVNPDCNLLWNIEQSETGIAAEYTSIARDGDSFYLLAMADRAGMLAAGHDLAGHTGWLWTIDRDGNTLQEFPAGQGYGALLLLQRPDGALLILDDGTAESNFTLTELSFP